MQLDKHGKPTAAMPARQSRQRTEWFLINRRVVVWGLAFLHWLAGILSIDTISRIGASIALTAGPRTRRHSRAVANIARAFPDMSSIEHNRIALGMWENFGRTVAESFIIDAIAAEQGRVVCADPEAVAVLLQRTGGAIFVGLHFGNWEATIVPAVQLGEHPIGIYKPLRSDQAEAYLRSLREKLYPAGLLPASQSTLLKAARHLRTGGSVCMLADHRDPAGAVVPFFGHPAPSATLPALMSVKYGLPLFAARVDRFHGVKFSVHIEKIRVTSSGDQASDIVTTTAAIQAVFERWIRARPEHWVWFYNRWQNTPATDNAAHQIS